MNEWMNESVVEKTVWHIGARVIPVQLLFSTEQEVWGQVFCVDFRWFSMF